MPKNAHKGVKVAYLVISSNIWQIIANKLVKVSDSALLLEVTTPHHLSTLKALKLELRALLDQTEPESW